MLLSTSSFTMAKESAPNISEWRINLPNIAPSCVDFNVDIQNCWNELPNETHSPFCMYCEDNEGTVLANDALNLDSINQQAEELVF